MTGRRRRIGAEPAEGGVHFRVWAPAHDRVAVVIGSDEHPLAREEDGYFSGIVASATRGTRYQFRLGDDHALYADPASRFQPDGPHGPSEVIDPNAYAWRDTAWRGAALQDAVIYEMHVGTFTVEGTWRAAIERLPLLADVGVTVVEMMPVNDFPGRFGWGYDGVDVFAPTRLYGEPDDLRRFVDAAHELGLAVILDVVYNHLGPDGCVLTKYTPAYFTDRYENEWGAAVNFDGDDSAGVREFFLENAAYWIDEFHLDGLRLDATQSIFDASSEHILVAIVRTARAAAGQRSVLVIGENEPQNVNLLTEYGFDALWNDDWHHSLRVATTGSAEAYYSDYEGKPQELLSLAKHGFLYQGQRYQWQKKRRGTPSLTIPKHRLVAYLQNHDQIANSARGERLDRLTAPGRLRAATAFLILGASTPMLFQGQEFAASTPFLYFADHHDDLAAAVEKGRTEFLTQFPSIATPPVRAALARPNHPNTFTQCKLDWSERHERAEIVALHRDLIALRRELRYERIDGAVLADDAFCVRYFNAAGDRLLIVNLGRDVLLSPVPEPLLAPPAEQTWTLLWSSEAPQYGGRGTPDVETDDGWRIPAMSALFLGGR
jgi:maltooligosyltrehalose trehalohydrolase